MFPSRHCEVFSLEEHPDPLKINFKKASRALQDLSAKSGEMCVCFLSSLSSRCAIMVKGGAMAVACD